MFSICGKCKNEMKILDKINKIFCQKCNYMYGLPRNCTYEIALGSEAYCPLDGF